MSSSPNYSPSSVNGSPGVPPPSDDTSLVIKRRAPTLVGIATFKVGKGIFFLLIALGIYSLSDDNLPEIFRSFIVALKLNPERQWFMTVFQKLDKITESNMLLVAAGTFAYALLALVEGIGLFMRFAWAAYLAIAESAIFIPIELSEWTKLWHQNHSVPWKMTILVILNLVIVVYLWVNRHRLFRHHHHHPPP